MNRDEIIKLIKGQKWEELRRVMHWDDLDISQVREMGKKILDMIGSNTTKTITDFISSGVQGVDPGTIAKYGIGILALVNGFTESVATGMSNIADGYMGSMKEDIVDLKKLAGTLGDDIKGLKVGKLFGDALVMGVDAVTKAIGNAVAAEGDGRETINRDLGITGELADKYRAVLVDAYSQTVLMGAKFEEIQEIVKGTSDSLYSVKILSSDTIANIYNTQKALGVSNSLIAESAAAFEDISIGLSNISGTLDKSGKFARSVGLNVRQYSEALVKNVTLLNQFGFKNGVDGLSKMVAKAQSLRLEMSTITALAEKVFNPEGAIELSATLNAIGAGFGSFADPLKLVYQATNDINGLQDSLTSAAASLATFNTQSGRFEINAINMRKAKDMADALGMSYQDLTNLAVRAAQKQQAAFKIDRMGGSFNEEQKEFLKNLSEMKDGRLVISMPDSITKQFGDAAKDGFLDISKLNQEGVQKLQDEMEKYNRETNRKPTEIATDQLRELERLTLTAKDIATKMGVRVSRSEPLQGVQKYIRANLNDENRRSISNQSKVIIDNTEASFDGVKKSLNQLVEVVTQDRSSTKGSVKQINNSNTETIERTKVLEKTLKAQPQPKKNPDVSYINNNTLQNSTSSINTKNTINEKSESISRKEIKIDMDIRSSQTLYDDMVRKLLKDAEFISYMKQKIKDMDS
jgi:hypothetical protein